MNQIVPIAIGAIALIVVAGLQWALIARLQARQRSYDPAFPASVSDELAQVASAASKAVQTVIEEEEPSTEARVVLDEVKTDLDNFNQFVMRGTTHGGNGMSLSTLNLLLRTSLEDTTKRGRINLNVVREMAAADFVRDSLRQVVTLQLARWIMERFVDKDRSSSEEVAPLRSGHTSSLR